MTLRMKRTIILTIVLVGCLQVALAQNTIESIRKAYQAQQAEIAEMAEDFPYDGYPPCYYQLSVVMNLPAGRTSGCILARWRRTTRITTTPIRPTT